MIAERNPRQRRESELQSPGSALGRRGTNEIEDDKSGRVRIRKAKTKKIEVNASAHMFQTEKKKKRCSCRITFVNLTLKKKWKKQNFWRRWFGYYWFNPLRRTQFSPCGKHTPNPVIESNKLMLHSDILTVSSESRAKHVNIWMGLMWFWPCIVVNMWK